MGRSTSPGDMGHDAAGQGLLAAAQAAVRRFRASALAPIELLRAVADHVQTVVPHVASSWQLTGPATQPATGDLDENVSPATRRELCATSAKPYDRIPGLVVLQDDGSVDSISDQAVEWLGELPKEGKELPTILYEVARRARLLADTDHLGPPAHGRLRLPSQQWLVVHGARLRSAFQGRTRTAVILEPANHSDMAPLTQQACHLTPRQRQIVEMLLRGASVTEIATTLLLSPYTVRDHIKAIYNKLGVRSRPELTAKLFHEDYGPMHKQDTAARH
jgi:DNA-binding CsgD family transcriptional regulator